MDSQVLKILTFALLPMIAMISGSIYAAFKPPGATFRSYIQHFAAGVVFAVIAVELLPDIVKKHSPVEVVIGFSLGVGLMLGIRAISEKYEKEEEANNAFPTGLIVAIGIDIFIDGILIGIGFAAGQKEGKLLTLALTTELLSLGLAVSSSFTKSGFARKKIILTTALLSLSTMAGATLGATLLQNLSVHSLEIILSFGLAALLFLVTEELLVEAHEEPETLMATSTFFIGFLIFLLLGMVS